MGTSSFSSGSITPSMLNRNRFISPDQSDRVNFATQKSVVQIKDLLDIQVQSYREFLQLEQAPDAREEIGIHKVFQSIFPISGHGELDPVLEYVSYSIGEANFELHACRKRGVTYEAPLRAKMRLTIYDKEAPVGTKKIKHIKEQEVYMGDIPLMTDTGRFIINGTDRVVVSQVHRSFGVLFSDNKEKNQISGKLLHSARIIPARGSWLDFEFDVKDHLFFKIDLNRKLPATILFKALDFSPEEILSLFFEHDTFEIQEETITWQLVPQRLQGEIASFDILDQNENVIVQQGQRVNNIAIEKIKALGLQNLNTSKEYLVGKILAKPVFNRETGEVIAETNTELTLEIIDRLIAGQVGTIATLYTNDVNAGPYISTTLRIDTTRNKQEALVEIYRCMRQGETPTLEAAENLFNNLFFNLDRYDLSKIGRMKINGSLDRKSIEGPRTLTKEDIVDIAKALIAIRDGKGKIDDVESLKVRRVRRVGEMAETQFRNGLVRLERAVREGLSKEIDEVMPQDLINAKPLIAALKEFFSGSPLSQYLDAVNPLASLAHGRRFTSLGPGGIPRDRAGSDLRDVNPFNYGRLCVIETPEGANIGLINAAAIYSDVDEFGFLVTPYRKVKDGLVTKEIQYLSAIAEEKYTIAQANAKIDANGKFTGNLIAARFQGEPVLTTPEKIQYMDVSPAQIVSIAAALIPFLEHNDANRALMGSNMQRQAVPLLKAQRPLVGTGIEKKAAVDSKAVITAKRGGIVDSVDAGRIVISVKEEEINEKEETIDIYNLEKYGRSNQGTCQNQKPLVRPGMSVQRGDLLADGASTEQGELALGRVMKVAFMVWKGNNYEDSIVLSDKVVKDDALTSVHVEEHVCIARDTTLGPDEITADIPNVNPSMLSNLDESGIVRLGAFVKPGDILVGKVTPKGETQLTPEEKLLRAIFGEKASNVKDSSLRVPNGIAGKVIDVSVFTKEGLEKDARAQAIEAMDLQKLRKDFNDDLRIREKDVHQRVKNLLVGAVAIKGPGKFEPNTKIESSYLDTISIPQWFEIELEDTKIMESLHSLKEHSNHIHKMLEKKYEYKHLKLVQGNELAPGVLKIIKVRVAVSRRIQSGDKMAGRHGNKGVVSEIVPVEDMPYLEDGTPIDIMLNPLGVPSRMNIGQLLETHLGWAAKILGQKISHLLDQKVPVEELREFLNQIYLSEQARTSSLNLNDLNDEEIVQLATRLRSGVPMASPVFDGVSETEIKRLLKLAGLPESGQTWLYDGQTGRKFDRPVTVGYIYMLKLNHLVDDKMHARSTGSYSLVTQQPLGGKAQFGGQRFGEMENWALQGYGAAHTLREMLTIKSDDVVGRSRAYKNIVDGKAITPPGRPESLNVLMKEIWSLGLRAELELKDSSNESNSK